MKSVKFCFLLQVLTHQLMVTGYGPLLIWSVVAVETQVLVPGFLAMSKVVPSIVAWTTASAGGPEAPKSTVAVTPALQLPVVAW